MGVVGTQPSFANLTIPSFWGLLTSSQLRNLAIPVHNLPWELAPHTNRSLHKYPGLRNGLAACPNALLLTSVKAERQTKRSDDA